MNFALLNKVSKNNSVKSKEEFDLDIFFKKIKPIFCLHDIYLDNDPDILIEAMELMDELTEIHPLENNMSLLYMLKES